MTKRTYVSNAANKAAVGLARWVTKQRGQKGQKSKGVRSNITTFS